jgi:hypothetical protein
LGKNSGERVPLKVLKLNCVQKEGRISLESASTSDTFIELGIRSQGNKCRHYRKGKIFI